MRGLYPLLWGAIPSRNHFLDGMFLHMSKNKVYFRRWEQGAGGRQSYFERLSKRIDKTLIFRLNLNWPSNTLVWIATLVAIPRIGVRCAFIINVQAISLPIPTLFYKKGVYLW